MGKGFDQVGDTDGIGIDDVQAPEKSSFIIDSLRRSAVKVGFSSLAYLEAASQMFHDKTF